MEGEARPGWGIGVAAVSAVGLGVAVYLTHLHIELFYGKGVGDSLCDLSAGFNCSAVNGSPESEIHGVPQSIAAIPMFVVTALLGLYGLRGADAQRRVAPVLAGVGLLAVLYSAHLAWISATVIGAWCLFCMVLYGVNVGLLGLGLARSGPLSRAPITLALSFVRTPLVVGGTTAAFALSFAGTWLGYTHVRDSVVAESAKAAVAAVAASPKPALGKPEADPGKRKIKLGVAKDLPVPAGAPTRGPASAKVTIVEFSDFQCPFCKRLATTLHQVQGEYPDDVRLVYLQFPMNTDCSKAPLKKSLHPNACHAAATAVCAGRQGKFWEMHDALFDAQADFGDKEWAVLAGAVGLDPTAFNACFASDDTQAAILADTQVGADLGASGTPTFFVNGRQLTGAQPIEVIRAVIDAELAGNKAALDLDVAIGTETTGPVTVGTDPVAVPGTSATIDALEASLDGNRAVSKAGAVPARSVSWYDADTACKAAGKRLCTEKEWLSACTGATPIDSDRNGVFSDDDQGGRAYGYVGDRLSGACADSRNPDAVGELVTGNHPKCGTPEGVYDLVGGVKEWVGLTPGTAATKGGSYSSGDSARCGYYRDDIAPETKDPATGFRCCSGPADPPPTEARPGRDVGEKIDALSLPLVGGGKVTTRSLGGHPAIVTFWATWCAPCQKEMPALAALYTAHKADGLQILAVSVDKDEAKLTAWLSAHPMPFPIARDPDGAILNTFSNRGLPTTLWVKRDGTIRLRTTGIPPGAEKRLGELVDELLASGTAG